MFFDCNGANLTCKHVVASSRERVRRSPEREGRAAAAAPPPPPPAIKSCSLMATFASSLCRSPFPLLSPNSIPSLSLSSRSFHFHTTPNPKLLNTNHLRFTPLACATPASPSDDYNLNSSLPKKSMLSSLIQDIEPLDVSLIQKDVPPTTIDAMKRTISSMLGLLPSDQFQVSIEALWEPLSKLLVSSMMTGYTLRNAEYRLCLERNLEIYEGSIDKQKSDGSRCEVNGTLLNDYGVINLPKEEEELPKIDNTKPAAVPDFGKITPEARQYISNLQSRLSSVNKELREVKRKTAALQMQQFVGEEKNDLLDYLRSLQPEKVAELSEPTSSELKETIYSVVHGLLATLSPKMHSRAPDLPDDTTSGSKNIEAEEDCIDLVEDTSLQFQPLISLTRDYLARLLFWCMLLGHYLRGLEYRLELTELLGLQCVRKNDTSSEQVA